MRAPANAASAVERPEKTARSVPPWFPAVGMAIPLPRRYARASAKTSCRPGRSVSFAVPVPEAPSAEAAVYVRATVAVVVPRFASVSSDVKCAPVPPTTSRRIGIVRVAANVAAGSDSNAPLSHAAPFGRAVPRASVAAQPAAVPASSAALPARSACVATEPPLSTRGPRRAFAFVRSLACAKEHVVPESTFPPCETKDVPGPFAVQFENALSAKTEFTTEGFREPSNEKWTIAAGPRCSSP